MDRFKKIKEMTLRLEGMMRNRFPGQSYFTETITWDDGDFKVRCIHSAPDKSKKILSGGLIPTDANLFQHVFSYYTAEKDVITYEKQLIQNLEIIKKVVLTETHPL